MIKRRNHNNTKFLEETLHFVQKFRFFLTIKKKKKVKWCNQVKSTKMLALNFTTSLYYIFKNIFRHGFQGKTNVL